MASGIWKCVISASQTAIWLLMLKDQMPQNYKMRIKYVILVFSAMLSRHMLEKGDAS